jgi:hypothetical protein
MDFKKFGSFLPYLHRVIEGAPRLLLSAHLTQSERLPIGRKRSNTEHASQWIDVRSFLVGEDEVDALSTRLGNTSFWGRGVRLPEAHACWLSEYPWHRMLGDVRASCAKAEPWLDLRKGLAQSTACSLDSEESKFALPSPSLLEDIEAFTGVLSPPKRSVDSGYTILDQRGGGVFWGSIAGNPLLAVDYLKFAAWMQEKRLVLLWCCLSERTVLSARQGESPIAESTQSAVVVLRPYKMPIELTGEREDRRLGDLLLKALE